MKRILLILMVAMFAASKLSAQTTPRRQQNLPPPVALREVSGIVKDSTGETLPGSHVKLVSKTDTANTTTNADGIFIFKNIKSASFTMSVTSIGYKPLVKKMLNNDAVAHLVLDPFILKAETNELKAVIIDGKPSIVYKIDTVEYKASDYKVRPNATLDELLKKMEGFEVGTDGSVTHQGQSIQKVKLNGKDYAGGGVAQAIQNLPADIIDKAQVVDDYGDDAARTGIKDGDPIKILNVTTKADKSVGTTGRLTGQGGNNDRYNAQLFVQRINANEQLGVIGSLANTVNGVASAGAGGGGGRSNSPGTTLTGGPSFNYRDQWSKKLQVNSSYTYSFTNNNSINHSYGNTKSSLAQSVFDDHNNNQSNSKNHRFSFEMEYSIDSANFLRITPTYSYTSSTSSGNSKTDNQTFSFFTDTLTGITDTTFEHKVVTSSNVSLSTSQRYGGNIFYQHIFKKPRRNFSIAASLNRTENKSTSDRNSLYQYYADSTLNSHVDADSLSHIIVRRNNINTTSTAAITYVEPVGKHAQFELSAQITHSVNDNVALSDSAYIDPATQKQVTVHLSRLDNIFDYSTTETRLGLNYAYNGTKLRFAIGTQFIPYVLDGTKVDNSGTGENKSTSISDFRIIPIFNLTYSFSKTQRLSFGYSGRNTEPNFLYIQPFVDRTNPDNTIYGNPNLKGSFTNTVRMGYNNYFPNSKFNISFNVSGSTVDDQTSSNIIDIREVLKLDTVNPKNTKYKNVRETHYVNVSGSHSIAGNYNIAKQLDDRRYNLEFNGTVSYSYNNYISNNQPYHTTVWQFNERFGPRITPNDNIEINPYIGYTVQKSFSAIPPRTGLGQTEPTINNTNIQTTKIAIDGKIYFLKSFQVHYSTGKNLVSGYPGASTNPLIIDAGFQKEFGARRNFVLTFDVFDLLHQNNFLQQSLTQGGATYTESNSLSRYFLVGFRYNFQKWSGSPKRNGRNMNRRGDGSFIYE